MNSFKADQPVPYILLVEDNPAHVELIFRSFENYRSEVKILHVADGETALDYLFRRGLYADPAQSPRPHLILLDLRLPRIDGLQVLTEIKTCPDFKQIPVIILTTSAAEPDIIGAYERYANSYLVKPVEFDQLTRLIESLGIYWLELNNCPPD